MRRYVAIAAGTGLIAAVLSVTGALPVLAQGALKPLMALIVNDVDHPVPVTGTVNIGNLGNLGGDPLPVRSVDNPARAAFQETMNVGNGQPGTITVPEGKRLVIEFISAVYDAVPGTCKSTDVRVSTMLNGQAAASLHHLIPISIFESPGLNSFVISQETRIYADSVAPVTFSFFSISSSACDAHQGFATVSGYLVDTP